MLIDGPSVGSDLRGAVDRSVVHHQDLVDERPALDQLTLDQRDDRADRVLLVACGQADRDIGAVFGLDRARQDANVPVVEGAPGWGLARAIVPCRVEIPQGARATPGDLTGTPIWARCRASPRSEGNVAPPQYIPDMRAAGAMGTVTALAATRRGAFTRRQAASRGISRKVVAPRLRHGSLIEPVRGVLVIAGSASTWRQSLMVRDVGRIRHRGRVFTVLPLSFTGWTASTRRRSR